MKALKILSILLVGAASAHAQVTYEAAEKITGPVNSAWEEVTPMLSPDGSRLYFTRAFHPQNVGGAEAGQDIWYAQKLDDGSWAAPANNLPGLNNGDNNALTGFSERGDTVFLINNYSPYPRRKIGVSFSTLKAGKWSAPQEYGVEVETKNDFYGIYVHPSQQVVLISMMGHESLGEEDLYVSVKGKNGKWSKAIHLGAVVNSAGFEISPFLSDDMTTLYFASNGRGGYGDADIWMATRLDEGWGNWSAPVNLGPVVNSSGFDAYYFERGNEAFFSSNRAGATADIYTVKVVQPVLPQEEPVLVADLQPAAEPEVTVQAEVQYDIVPEAVTVYFSFDSHTLSAESLQSLQKVASFLKKQREMTVAVNGYADPNGPATYNLKLSEKRAAAVAAYLTEAAGIGKERITLKAFGESGLISQNIEKSGANENRRVELVFSTQVLATE